MSARSDSELRSVRLRVGAFRRNLGEWDRHGVHLVFCDAWEDVFDQAHEIDVLLVHRRDIAAAAAPVTLRLLVRLSVAVVVYEYENDAKTMIDLMLRGTAPSAREYRLGSDGLLSEIMIQDSLHHHFGRLPGLDWLVRRAITLAYLYKPPFGQEVSERLLGPINPFPKTIGDLAILIGCSNSFLRRRASEAGVSLSIHLRQANFLRGLLLFSEEGESLHRVAIRLGFSYQSGLSNFCRRLTGMPPSKAMRIPLEKWLHHFFWS